MSFNAAALQMMLDKGLSLSDVVEIATANEQRSDPTAAERKRRQRAKEKAERDMSHRDVTRDTVSLKEDQNPSGTVLPDEADASSPVRQPLGEARDHWNEVAAATGWPQVRALSPNRQKLLSARLREHGLDGWKAAVARARASPYLAGPDPPSWFTFPWIIKSENFLKVTEGNYDRNRSSNQRQPSGWEAAYRANMGQGGCV
jgi:hypothetical protein